MKLLRRCLFLMIIVGSSPVLPGQTETPQPDDVKAPVPPTPDEIFLFRPSGSHVGNWSPDRLNYQDVTFQSADRTKLHGWYCPAQDAVATILFLHGNAGNLTHRAALLRKLQSELKVNVFIVDFRGYGKSEGLPTVPGALADSRAARAELARRADCKESDIVLMGRSLGGALAIQLAADSKCRGLIVESSFTSLRSIARHLLPRLAWLVPPEKLNSVSALQAYTGPVLLSHGTADRLIPYRMGQELFRAAQGRKEFVTIRGGGHNDRLPAYYYVTMREFLSELP